MKGGGRYLRSFKEHKIDDVFSVVLISSLQSFPALVTSPSALTFCPNAAESESEASRSEPRDQRGAGSGGEDTDSETDCKSSASSNASK